MAYLQRHGATQVTVLDKQGGLTVPAGVAVRTGADYLTGLNDFTLIFRSPGIRPDLPELVAFTAAGGRQLTAVRLFMELCPCPIIGVTGTKGKGTTASLIYEMLRAADRTVYLGGNIGKSPLDFIDDLTPTAWVVLEMSSFQLLDADRSPHIAVVINVTSEHLDYHRGVEEYIAAKQNIVRHQSANDYLVVHVDYPTSATFASLTPAAVYPYSVQQTLATGTYRQGETLVFSQAGQVTPLLSVADICLKGAHNIENVCAASTVAQLIQLPLAAVQSAVRHFAGLPYRLQDVGTKQGVLYINDSFSTIPETAIAAIKAFAEPKVLILGGSDKGSDYTALGQMIHETPSVHSVILIGQMAEAIAEAIARAGGHPRVQRGGGTMAEVVRQAAAAASSGSVVLLSPGCASFGMFKNYKERGEQFTKEVSLLPAE